MSAAGNTEYRIHTWYIGILPLYCTEDVDVSGAVDYFLTGLYAILIFLLNSPMMSILIKYIPSILPLSVWPHLFRGAGHEKGERAVEVVPGI